MSALDEARAHLRKAKEFLEAAELNADRELFNAAASAAVTSGINSKDAICLALTGTTAKTDTHTDAVEELKAAGPSMAVHATTLGRLLTLKNKSQYQTIDVARSDALKAIEWATRLVAATSAIVPA
jgi:uncharacterized protein (UPF0332 family)